MFKTYLNSNVRKGAFVGIFFPIFWMETRNENNVPRKSCLQIEAKGNYLFL